MVKKNKNPVPTFIMFSISINNMHMHTTVQKHKIPVLLLNLVFELDNIQPHDTTTQHNSLTQRTW